MSTVEEAWRSGQTRELMVYIQGLGIPFRTKPTCPCAHALWNDMESSL